MEDEVASPEGEEIAFGRIRHEVGLFVMKDGDNVRDTQVFGETFERERIGEDEPVDTLVDL